MRLKLGCALNPPSSPPGAFLGANLWGRDGLKETEGLINLAQFSASKARLRVVPHFSSGIVERAKRERVWKSPHARGVIFTWARVSHALLSLRKNGRLLVVYSKAREKEILFSTIISTLLSDTIYFASISQQWSFCLFGIHERPRDTASNDQANMFVNMLCTVY